MDTPITADNWRSFASCRLGSGYDPETWFPTAKTGTPAHAEQAKEPKSICREFCPARSMCLAWALESNQEFGIAGGLDEDERRLLKRRDARRRQQTARVTAIHPATDDGDAEPELVAS